MYSQITHTPDKFQVWTNLTEFEWTRELTAKKQYHDPKGVHVHQFFCSGQLIEEIRLPSNDVLTQRMNMTAIKAKGTRP